MNSLTATALALVAIVALTLLAQTQSLTVHLVCHTHDDVGWLKTVDQYYIGANNSIQHAAVQYVLDSVVLALSQNSDRKFSYVEQAFFQRWWRQQTPEKQNLVKGFVTNKQLEFINGGWCMHDEAAAHYVDMIDQTTLGHKFINDEFGVQPTIGWQIDPFGHSATQAALLSAEVGFDALFFGRIDYQDHNRRIAAKELEYVWRASASLGKSAQVFTGAFQSGNYGPPDGFCFDWFCGDLPIQDDRRLEDYNVESRVNDFVTQARNQAGGTRGDIDTMNIMWTLGSDFMHENSNEWFKNLDKLVKYVNADGRVKVQYSTPSMYVAAKNAEPVQWTVKTDDHFPYADGDNSYWTGYFTSRPALKRYIRETSALLQVARHLEFLGSTYNGTTELLWEAQGVAQHHDAVSGTSKQHVAYDYARRLARGAAIAEAIISSGLGNLTTMQGQTIPSFTACPLTNVSLCPASQSGSSLVVVIYNPQARQRTSLVRVPINSTSYQVVDAKGAAVTFEIVRSTVNKAKTADSAAFTLNFLATIPGIGFDTYFITRSSNAPRENARALKTAQPDATTISNAAVTLTFDANSGLLTSYTDKTSGQTYPLTTDFGWYPAYQRGNDQDDGAYIFRPDQNWAYPLSQATLSIIPGTVTQEARQVFGDWLQQTIRLVGDSPRVEFEWTVGPVPIGDNRGKNVVVRFNSSLASNGVWFTDSNGREFQNRTRNFRPTWKWNPTQPVAGNYYPANTGAWLTDGKMALVVDNDRSQGCASLSDGSLEFMVHRRLIVDDGRGVNEPLNETAGITGADGTRLGTGLVITGTHYLHLTTYGTAARAARITQDSVFQPPHVSYAPLTGTVAQYVSGHNTFRTFLNNSLPYNVELMTAQLWSETTLLIRLSHQFGINEDNELSQSVTVDLATLFLSPPTITSVAELSLTANQAVNAHTPLKWNTTDDDNVFKPKRYLQSTLITLTPLQIRTFAVTFAV